MVPSLIFTRKSFCKNLLIKLLLTIPIFLLPAMAPLWLRLQANVNTVSAIVHPKAFSTVIAAAIFHSLTAISDGIPPETVFFMVMISTCLWLLTLKVIFLFFQCFILLPCMIPMGFFILFSGWKVFCPIFTLKNSCLILPMTQCLIISTASAVVSHLLLTWMRNVGSVKNTKTTLPLEKMAFLSAKPAEKWIMTALNLPKHGSSSAVPSPAANTVVPVVLHVPLQNTEEQSILPWKIIRVL